MFDENTERDSGNEHEKSSSSTNGEPSSQLVDDAMKEAAKL